MWHRRVVPHWFTLRAEAGAESAAMGILRGWVGEVEGGRRTVNLEGNSPRASASERGSRGPPSPPRRRPPPTAGEPPSACVAPEAAHTRDQ